MNQPFYRVPMTSWLEKFNLKLSLKSFEPTYSQMQFECIKGSSSWARPRNFEYIRLFRSVDVISSCRFAHKIIQQMLSTLLHNAINVSGTSSQDLNVLLAIHRVPISFSLQVFRWIGSQIFFFRILNAISQSEPYSDCHLQSYSERTERGHLMRPSSAKKQDERRRGRIPKRTLVAMRKGKKKEILMKRHAKKPGTSLDGSVAVPSGGGGGLKLSSMGARIKPSRHRHAKMWWHWRSSKKTPQRHSFSTAARSINLMVPSFDRLLPYYLIRTILDHSIFSSLCSNFAPSLLVSSFTGCLLFVASWSMEL